MMPYELASWMLGQWSGLTVSATTLWHWVQQKGQQAQVELEAALAAQANGEGVVADPLPPAVANLALAISADGVMVPFRPQSQTARGQTRWREVKVAILARLGQRLNRAQQVVPQLVHRRLVAVLGDIDQFIPQLQLEARRQAFESAPQVIWLSDGGPGFWRVYRTCFAHCAVAVLDFFHAAGHLWRATTALFDDADAPEALAWFQRWRHQLRHGQQRRVLRSLTSLLNADLLKGSAFTTLSQVQAYFQRHHRQMRYQHFEQHHYPLGSGMVESACKWLIQQRFKGVGMRWSEDGFNHLLLLRLAWVNHRFDDLFPSVPTSVHSYPP